jgi:hypothetical protein
VPPRPSMALSNRNDCGASAKHLLVASQQGLTANS